MSAAAAAVLRGMNSGIGAGTPAFGDRSSAVGSTAGTPGYLMSGGAQKGGSGSGQKVLTGPGGEELPTAKVIIAGSPRVGKTCILRRFVGDDVYATLERYEPTVGADFRIAHVPINDDRTITLQLWDSAGDEKMMSIGRSLYKNADCLVLVYDITSRESFEALKLYWSSYIMYGRPYEPDEFPCLLVGNKCDLGDRRAVPMEEVLDWCSYQRPSRPLTYMECSSLRNINIKDIFVFVGDAIYDYTLRVDSGTGKCFFSLFFLLACRLLFPAAHCLPPTTQPTTQNTKQHKTTKSDDETEGEGSVYTTGTAGTETGNDTEGDEGSARHSGRRSHSDNRKIRESGGRGGRVPLTPGGDSKLEQGCGIFNCIGLPGLPY